jgi:hypothetical protein
MMTASPPASHLLVGPKKKVTTAKRMSITKYNSCSAEASWKSFVHGVPSNLSAPAGDIFQFNNSLYQI